MLATLHDEASTMQEVARETSMTSIGWEVPRKKNRVVPSSTFDRLAFLQSTVTEN